MSRGEVGEAEFIVVPRCDDAVDKMEVIYLFGPGDVDEALVELDRLHAKVESGHRG